jgi:hypothetical protein
MGQRRQRQLETGKFVLHFAAQHLHPGGNKILQIFLAAIQHFRNGSSILS